MTLSCSTFSRQLKIQNKLDQKIRDIFPRKSTEITRVILLFAILPETSVRVQLSCFYREDREFKKRSAIDWARKKFDWEGGQPKLPNGPGNETS